VVVVSSSLAGLGWGCLLQASATATMLGMLEGPQYSTSRCVITLQP
jgi:hypothetical protein